MNYQPAIATSHVTVREVRGAVELAGLREPWMRIAAKTADLEVFQSLDWLLAQTTNVRDGMQIRAVLVYDKHDLVGILPLALHTERTRIGKVRVLGYPLDGWGTCYGPLGPDPLVTMATGLRHIADTCRDWDLLDLRWVPQESVPMLQVAFQRAGLRTQASPWGERSIIDLSESWDLYWNGLSSKMRNNIRRCEKKLARLGTVTFHHVRPGIDPGVTGAAWDILELCEQVASVSWQGAATSGNTISDAEVRDLIRQVHASVAPEGNVSMHVLCISGEPVAFNYNYVVDGRVFGLRTGFDPRFAKAGPGTALFARTIQNAFERNDRSFDLGETPSRYKAYWRTSSQPTFRVCHYPTANVRAQCLRLKRNLLRLSEAPSEMSK